MGKRCGCQRTFGRTIWQGVGSPSLNPLFYAAARALPLAHRGEEAAQAAPQRRLKSANPTTDSPRIHHGHRPKRAVHQA